MENNQVKKYILDFTHCQYASQLYSLIRQEMDLPEWFGNNPSAFWDCLTGMIEVPAVIIFRPQVRNKDLLEHINQLIAIARRAEAQDDLGITVEIQP